MLFIDFVDSSNNTSILVFLFSLKDSIQIRTDEGKKVKLRAPGNNVMIRNFWSLNVWYKPKHERYKLLAKALR